MFSLPLGFWDFRNWHTGMAYGMVPGTCVTSKVLCTTLGFYFGRILLACGWNASRGRAWAEVVRYSGSLGKMMLVDQGTAL